LDTLKIFLREFVSENGVNVLGAGLFCFGYQMTLERSHPELKQYYRDGDKTKKTGDCKTAE